MAVAWTRTRVSGRGLASGQRPTRVADRSPECARRSRNRSHGHRRAGSFAALGVHPARPDATSAHLLRAPPRLPRGNGAGRPHTPPPAVVPSSRPNPQRPHANHLAAKPVTAPRRRERPGFPCTPRSPRRRAFPRSMPRTAPGLPDRRRAAQSRRIAPAHDSGPQPCKLP